MQIGLNEALKQQIYDSVRGQVAKDRSGVHLSDLIYCTRKAFFRKKKLTPKPTDEQCTLWITGFAFQAYMFPYDSEQTIQVDGIDCTPDIQSGMEVKSTRQSSKKFDLVHTQHWTRQILGYCKALGKLEYELVVLFICGNYAPPFPLVQCYHIEATQEEVDGNWSEVLERASLLKEALEKDVIPSPNCMDWEWKYCECVDMCQDTPCRRKKVLEKGK